MFHPDFTEYDLACLRALRISTEPDTRTRAEADARFRVPEWLRRAAWRQFWAEQDAVSRPGEQSGCAQREAPLQEFRSIVQKKPGDKPAQR